MTQTSTRRPSTPATVEQTAAGLVHAARGASDPYTEAASIVTGLFPEGNDYSRRLHAAIEALRPVATTAAQVITAARAAHDYRTDTEERSGWEWSDADSHRRYVAVLRSVRFWRVADRIVYATVTDTRDGRIWGGVAAEALDAAAQLDDVFATANVEQVSSTTYKLTW